MNLQEVENAIRVMNQAAFQEEASMESKKRQRALQILSFLLMMESILW